MWHARYTIPFQSRLGTQYMVYVMTQEQGTMVTLTGAAEPFVTQEDESDNIFTPVRTQSGYLRVIDETGGTLLASLMPANNTEKMVLLYSGTWNSGMTTFTPTSLKWCGFLCSQAFTQPWDGQKHVLEFPVKSLMAALFDIQIQETSFYVNHNVAYLIKSAFEALGYHPTSVVTICDIDSAVNDFMRIVLQYRAFCSVEEISNVGETTTSISGLTYGQAFSNVLALYGLSAREEGSVVYFAQYDLVGGVLKTFNFTWSNISTIAGGSTVSLTPGSLSRGSITHAMFRSTNNTVGYANGAKKAIVNVILNQDKPTISPPNTAEDNSTLYEVNVYDGNTVFAQAHPNRTGGNETFTYLKYHGRTYLSTSDYTEMLSHCILTGFRVNWYYQDVDLVTGCFPVRWFYQQSPTEFPQLISGLFFNTNYTYNLHSTARQLCYSISSGYSIQMDDGFLNVNFNIYNFLWNTTPNVGTIFGSTIQEYYGVDAYSDIPIAIRVGSLYWNKSAKAWVSTGDALSNSFEIRLTNSTIDSNKDNDMNVEETEGYFIPVQGMEGVVEFYIFNDSWLSLASSRSISEISPYKIINNLKVSYLPSRNAVESSRGSNVYMQTIAINSFSGEEEIYLDLGTRNNNAQSPTFIMSPAGEYIEELIYTDNTTDRPELRLLQRMVAHYGIARRTMKAVLRGIGDIMESLFSIDSKNFFALDATHNWRDDEQEIKFIEI